MNQDEYQMGKTKLFIKAPESVRNRCILFFCANPIGLLFSPAVPPRGEEGEEVRLLRPGAPEGLQEVLQPAEVHQGEGGGCG